MNTNYKFGSIAHFIHIFCISINLIVYSFLTDVHTDWLTDIRQKTYIYNIVKPVLMMALGAPLYTLELMK